MRIAIFSFILWWQVYDIVWVCYLGMGERLAPTCFDQQNWNHAEAIVVVRLKQQNWGLLLLVWCGYTWWTVGIKWWGPDMGDNDGQQSIGILGYFKKQALYIYIYIDLLSNTHKSGNMIPTTEHSWDEPFHVAPPPNFSTRSLLFFSYDVFLVQLPPILLLVKSRFCLQVGDFSPDP